MSALRFKDGVTLTPNAAGARLLGSIERAARTWPTDLTVTAGSDSHPPTDPHTLGQAFDVRTHGMLDGDKQALLRRVLEDLEDSAHDVAALMVLPGIWFALATTRWFGQIEHHNEPTEHAHVQLRNGRTFP